MHILPKFKDKNHSMAYDCIFQTNVQVKKDCRTGQLKNFFGLLKRKNYTRPRMCDTWVKNSRKLYKGQTR